MIRTTKENQDDEGNGTSFRNELHQQRIKGEGAGGAHPTPPPEMSCGFLIAELHALRFAPLVGGAP